MIREQERVCKAKWRANKVQNDPNYVEKVRQYDRECKRIVTSCKVTSPKSKKCDVTQSTPMKKPPSYYKVLSMSKKSARLAWTQPQDSHNDT